MAEAEIAQTLNQAGDRVNYDAAAKSLVAQKSVLAYILKSALDEYANVSVKKIAEELRWRESVPRRFVFALFDPFPLIVVALRQQGFLLCGENHPKIAACKVLRSFRRGKFRSGKRKVAGYPV